MDAAYSTPTTITAICTKNDNTVIAAFCDINFNSFLNTLLFYHIKRYKSMFFRPYFF